MKTNTSKLFAGVLAAAICLGQAGQARAFWTDSGPADSAAGQLGITAEESGMSAISLKGVQPAAVEPGKPCSDYSGFAAAFEKGRKPSDEQLMGAWDLYLIADKNEPVRYYSNNPYSKDYLNLYRAHVSGDGGNLFRGLLRNYLATSGFDRITARLNDKALTFGSEYYYKYGGELTSLVRRYECVTFRDEAVSSALLCKMTYDYPIISAGAATYLVLVLADNQSSLARVRKSEGDELYLHFGSK